MEHALLDITELRLGLPGDCSLEEKKGKKRAFSDMVSASDGGDADEGCARTGVVGWPPICLFRQKRSYAKRCLKVSMDGAPFLRKVDLNECQGYSDLSRAVEKLFGSSRIGNVLEKNLDFSEYKPIYEDKDGDWMLVGDVPWEMFVESCRRLRLMRSSPHTRLQTITTADRVQVDIQS